MSLRILFEDNHLLVVDKPAGVPATHYDGNAETVDRMAKDYLKAKFNKPGNVFLGVVHRLDKPTTGVLAFARTSKAAARLSEQFRLGTAKKTYWAVVSPSALADGGVMEDHLLHVDNEHRVTVVPPGTPGAKAAAMEFRVLVRSASRVLLELIPRSGRKHQLRVQLAHRAAAIVGDAKYGSHAPFANGIALHARSLTIAHPIGGEAVTFIAEVPESWRAFAALLPAATPSGG
jgi:23S rRNA pseudouridine1911/1915/1917 synthase